jgi:hypothetical protein
MKTIVITSPDHWPGEETVIVALLIDECIF